MKKFFNRHKKTILYIVVIAALGFGTGQLLSGPQSWYNVLDYGLKGDSSTDNTAALQKLLNFIPPGATIFFPPGKYLTANHVYQNQRSVKWKFANFDVPLNNGETYPITSGIVHTNNSDTCIIISNTSYGTIFEDASIMCTATSSATSTSRGVFFGTAQEARIYNSQFLNFGIPAEVKNGGLFIFENSHFYNGTVCNLQLADSLNPDNGDGIVDRCTFATITTASAGNDHIKYISGGGLHVVNSKFNSGASDFAGSCINLNSFIGTVDFFFIGNSCEGFAGNAITCKQNGYGLQNAVITGNEFFPDGTSPMIYLDATSVSTGIYNVSINDNNFSGTGSDTAIYLQGGNTSIYNVSIGVGNTYNAVGRRVVRGSTAAGNTKIYVTFPTSSQPQIAETPTSLKFTLDGTFNFHSITLTGNDTIFIQDGVYGMFFQIQMIQDGTGGRIPLLYTGGSNYIQGSVVPINIFNTTAGASCIVQGMINGSGQLTVYGIQSQFTNGSIPFAKNAYFWQDNANLFWDATNARLCSGCTVPVGPITSANSTVSSQHNGVNSIWNGSAADPATMDIMKSRGTFASPTAVQNSDYNSVLNFWAYDGAAYRRQAGIGTRVVGTVSSGHIPLDMYFYQDTASGGIFLYDVYGVGAVRATIKWLTGNWIFGNSSLDSNATIQLPQSTTTNANIRFSLNGADPTSPTNGMFWYNSNAHALNIRDNGATINLLNFASLASPAFTGTPTAPTAAFGTNTTQIATTAYVITAISVAHADLAAQTGTISNITSFTPTANGTFRIGVYSAVTAISAGTLNVVVTWTDENNTPQTANLFAQGSTTAALSTTGFTPYPTIDIRAKSGAIITISSAFSGVSITYDIGATISQIR